MLREGQLSTEEILQSSEQDMQMDLMCKEIGHLSLDMVVYDLLNSRSFL